MGETWQADGNLIAPVDQRFNSVLPTQDRIVAAGAEVRCEVEAAQDWDTRTVTTPATNTTPVQVNTSYEMDWPLTYKWTADKGTFKGAVNGLSAVWVAPDNITATTTVTIKCTIDDPPGARVIAPETGSRDDAPTVRTAKVKVMLPEVKFTGSELVNGTLRACAGGVDDHGQSDSQYRAHTRKVDLQVTLNDYPMGYAKFSLRFENNKGHNYGDGRTRKVARLHKTNEPFDVGHPWKESLEVQADDKGKVSVWVLSSDVINKPRLQAILKPVAAPREPVKLGEIACDFAASETFRNFANPVDPDDPDDFGWIFDFPKLVNPTGPTNQKPNTPAKVYLKFKIDPNKAENAGNWQFVNGHQLLLSVVRITTVDFKTGDSNQVEGTPEELKSYAYFANSISAIDTASVTRTTSGKGETAPQPYVIAGPDLKASFTVFVQAEDKSEHKN